MSVTGICVGNPYACHGRTFLPVVTLFSEYHKGSAIGSATVVALFILEGEQVYFTALSEKILLEDVLIGLGLCPGKSGQDRRPSAKRG
jgi:hypothetical protein